MSDMEIFYGKFKKSDKDIVPSDTDEFYDMEQDTGIYYVMVEEQLYAFWELRKLDVCGFTIVFPKTKDTLFIAQWYNGGAELHEVVEDLIKSTLTKDK